jgi:hypothetical protein
MFLKFIASVRGNHYDFFALGAKEPSHTPYLPYNTGIVSFDHTIDLCAVCNSQSKKELFPYKPLTSWSLQHRCVCLLWGMNQMFIERRSCHPIVLLTK